MNKKILVLIFLSISLVLFGCNEELTNETNEEIEDGVNNLKEIGNNLVQEVKGMDEEVSNLAEKSEDEAQ